MKALVIHPRLDIWAGGEYVAMIVCQALQEAGYQVTLASDRYEPEMAEKKYGMGDVMKRCSWISTTPVKVRFPRLLSFQRLFSIRRIKNAFIDADADVVFSTQSSLYLIPNRKVFHCVYDYTDLFAGAGVQSPLAQTRFYYQLYYLLLREMRKLIVGPYPPATHFFAFSKQVLNDMRQRGFNNASFLAPPARLITGPGVKEKRVLAMARVLPWKRLEIFVEIARRLPEYRFVLLGITIPAHLSYKNKILSDTPDNFQYIEGPAREYPHELARAKVFVYAGTEPGINLTTIEAVGAGCIPITPASGGGAEVVDLTGVGYKFRTLEEAVELVQYVMLTDSDIAPEEISGRTGIFNPELFKKEVLRLV